MRKKITILLGVTIFVLGLACGFTGSVFLKKPSRGPHYDVDAKLLIDGHEISNETFKSFNFPDSLDIKIDITDISDKSASSQELERMALLWNLQSGHKILRTTKKDSSSATTIVSPSID